MTVTGALSPFGKRGEMSPHKRASGKRLRPTIQIENDKRRSHQQSKALFLRGSPCVPTRLISAALARLPTFWRRLRLEKFPKIAISRKVGDSVLYHSPFALETGREAPALGRTL